MRRTVPVRERITTVWVSAPPRTGGYHAACAIRHARGRKHDVAVGQFIQFIFLVEVRDARARGAFFFRVVAEDQTALHLAANALQGCCRQHAFRRAARADVKIEIARRLGGCNHATTRRHRQSA